MTNILLAPLYPPAILAKQLASLALAASDRLVIGIAVARGKTTTRRQASTSTGAAGCLTTR